MTDEVVAEYLRVVKTALGISGEFHDEILKIYIAEVLDFMRGAGIPEHVLIGAKANGAVVRGVSDLWNYGQGDAQLSPYFFQRVIQLCRGEEDVQTDGSQTDDNADDDSEIGNGE